MAEQSFLAKLGARVGIVGSSAALAIAAPIATGNYDPSCHTDSARTGWYFDRTAGAEKIGMMVGGIAGPLYTRSGSNVNMSILIPTPTLTMGDGTGVPSIQLNGAAATNRTMQWQTAGVARWDITCDNTAESGSNAGSNFVVNAYTDAGAIVDASGTFSIVRAALGAFTINRPLTVAAGTITSNINSILSSVTWNNAGVTFTANLFNITDTASAAASKIIDFQIGSTSRLNLRKDGLIVQASVDDLTSASWSLTRTFTLTGNITDSAAQIQMSAALAGAFTITRYNYFQISNPTGAATITNGCVLRFNANAGTHKAVDGGTTKTTPGGVDAWMKHNVNGTIYFQPLYTSKTT